MSIPSSRMTLSPNILTSNSRFARRRFNMFLLGLLLALTSKAHTPIRPKGAGFAVGYVSFCLPYTSRGRGLDQPSSFSLW